jgi:hypothetical protein
VNPGTLPFRVWQIYNEMIKFLRDQDIPRFVCAAGILSHYVGDACQPLHSSQYCNGIENDHFSHGVHTPFETDMVEKVNPAAVVAGVNEYVANFKAVPTIEGGKAAAISTIKLMKRSFEILPPLEIIAVYKSSNHRVRIMFEQLGTRTCAVLGEGSLALANLWESAWKQGGGDSIETQMEKIPRASLENFYMHDKKFLESYMIKDPGFALALKEVAVV